MKTFDKTQKGKEISTKSTNKKKKKKGKEDEQKEEELVKPEPTSVEEDPTPVVDTKKEPEFLFQPKKKAKKVVMRKFSPKKKKGQNGKGNKDSPAKKKIGREWNDSNKLTKRNLDRFTIMKDPSKAKKSYNIEEFKNQYLGEGDKAAIDEMFMDEDEEFSDSSDDGQIQEKSQKKGFFSRLSSNIRSFAGGKLLTEEDLKPILQSFQEQLMSKNVAQEISEKLCDSVKANLL